MIELAQFGQGPDIGHLEAKLRQAIRLSVATSKIYQKRILLNSDGSDPRHARDQAKQCRSGTASRLKHAIARLRRYSR